MNPIDQARAVAAPAFHPSVRQHPPCGRCQQEPHRQAEQVGNPGECGLRLGDGGFQGAEGEGQAGQADGRELPRGALLPPGQPHGPEHRHRHEEAEGPLRQHSQAENDAQRQAWPGNPACPRGQKEGQSQSDQAGDADLQDRLAEVEGHPRVPGGGQQGQDPPSPPPELPPDPPAARNVGHQENDLGEHRHGHGKPENRVERSADQELARGVFMGCQAIASLKLLPDGDPA